MDVACLTVLRTRRQWGHRPSHHVFFNYRESSNRCWVIPASAARLHFARVVVSLYTLSNYQLSRRAGQTRTQTTTMGNPQIHNSTTPQRMSVDITLCGSIPRSSFVNHSGARCGLQELSNRYSGYGAKGPFGNGLSVHPNSHKLDFLAKSINVRPILSERQPLGQICEAPSWAVPATGDTRLEVCTVFAVCSRTVHTSHIPSSLFAKEWDVNHPLI